jgi:hypothetical protein
MEHDISRCASTSKVGRLFGDAWRGAHFRSTKMAAIRLVDFPANRSGQELLVEAHLEMSCFHVGSDADHPHNTSTLFASTSIPATPKSIGAKVKEHIIGLVAVCPRAEPPSAEDIDDVDDAKRADKEHPRLCPTRMISWPDARSRCWVWTIQVCAYGLECLHCGSSVRTIGRSY